MFTNVLPQIVTSVVLIAGGLASHSHSALPGHGLGDTVRAGVVDHASAPASATSRLAPIPSVSAQLFITYVGRGYYLVVVSGQSSERGASVGVRVYGDDSWFDDFLFSMTGRTDPAGGFALSRTVYRSVLDEDWGRDEIYAKVEVSGAGRTRTNKISRSF